MNNVVLIGRLTRDPELRYIPESQNAVATFTLAVDRPFQRRNRLTLFESPYSENKQKTAKDI